MGTALISTSSPANAGTASTKAYRVRGLVLLFTCAGHLGLLGAPAS